jgi:hypothetical protein
MRNIRFLAFALVALMVAAATQAAVHDTVRRTFNVAEGGTLTLETDLGDVLITGGGGTGVTVEIARDAKANDVFRDHELTFDQKGNDVSIRSRYSSRDFGWFRWTSPLALRYTIRVPARYNLNVRTSGGEVEVRDIGGTVDCRTSGGDLRFGRIDGAVVARSSGGSVEIDSATSIDVKTSGGSIDIRHATGDILAKTSGGGIEIGGAGGAIDAVTSGGSIEAVFDRQPRTESRLSTSGGGVTVTIARSVAFNLDAHTSGGGISSDVPVTVSGTQNEESLVGKINGGGPRLVVRTSGGGIRMKQI